MTSPARSSNQVITDLLPNKNECKIVFENYYSRVFLVSIILELRVLMIFT